LQIENVAKKDEIIKNRRSKAVQMRPKSSKDQEFFLAITINSKNKINTEEEKSGPMKLHTSQDNEYFKNAILNMVPNYTCSRKFSSLGRCAEAIKGAK
jgi:hypothetical protein